MKKLREIAFQQLRHGLVRSSIALLGALSVMTTIAPVHGWSADRQSGSSVEVHRYRFFDSCFYADVGTVIKTTTGLNVTLKIAHKQSSGQCGCRSAALQAHVFTGATLNEKAATSFDGKRLVQTTPKFSNTLQRYALTIIKRSETPQQHYKIWLSCAS